MVLFSPGRMDEMDRMDNGAVQTADGMNSVPVWADWRRGRRRGERGAVTGAFVVDFFKFLLDAKAHLVYNSV